MKKDHIRKISILQLIIPAVFILICAIYTYASAAEIMDEYMSDAKVNASWSLPESTDKLTSDTIIGAAVLVLLEAVLIFMKKHKAE
ncbi:MAG: hypothetical protein IKH75_13940 [Ruminococcus sp.]|nr:hypothetical protein [Ruminococcus sp.]